MDRGMALLVEYENILLGNQSEFGSAHMGRNIKQPDLKRFFRYMFEEILGWTPEEIYHYCSVELLHKLKCKKPLFRLDFPPEVDKTEDINYIAAYLYPDIIKVSKRDLVIKTYERVLAQNKRKYPKGFFLASNHQFYASVCLMWAINDGLAVSNISSLYQFFSDKKLAIPFLKKYRLIETCCSQYESPIDMLHVSLPEDQKSDFYYSYWKFTALEKEAAA